MAYSGKFIPQNKSKYAGDPGKITYRSNWERQAMKWCDMNPDVEYWGSEETVIPYICGTDKKQHRYFMDLSIKFSNGKVLLVEIKPAAQTKSPVSKKGKSKAKLLNECLTYEKNISKWQAAERYAKQKGWFFQIWTEHTLEAMGIKLLSRKQVQGKK